MQTPTVLSVLRAPPWWLGILVVVGLWLLARPYAGLRHDGILYLGQTLLHLDPVRMGGDIFFAHGSQDRFSLFARLLAQAYALWDVAAVQIIVLCTWQAALLGALWRLLAGVTDPLQRWLGLCAVAILSHVYGGWGLFAFAERFVTARVVAEPLALWALVALLERRFWLAAAALLVAGLMHPLMTLPMLVVMWLVLLVGDRRWAWALLLLPVPLVLAWSGIEPFTALAQRYDDTWWQHVQRANGAVLLATWRGSDWQIVAMDLVLLGAASRLLPSPASRACIALAAALLLLLVVSGLGADLARNVLVTQLQLWRVQSYAHMVALAMVPLVLWRAWQREAHGPLLALALGAFVVAVNARWAAGWVFGAWAAACAWLGHAKPPLSRPVQRIMLATTAAALLGLSAAAIAETLSLIAPDIERVDAPTVLLLAATTPALALPWAIALLQGWTRGGAARVLVVGAALLMVATALAHWDRRSAWVRHIESGWPTVHPWSSLIPPDAQVYWHGDLAATWVLLKRRHYVSDDQGAGSLFNRATAIEVARRRDVLAPVRMQFEICALHAALSAPGPDDPPCAPTAEVLQRICSAEKGPDFLVFETRIPDGLVAQWRFAGDPARPRDFHLYDCLQLR